MNAQYSYISTILKRYSRGIFTADQGEHSNRVHSDQIVFNSQAGGWALKEAAKGAQN
jgi:phosphopantetheinyl transferase (holo-ACP synthase)